jgi:hypothetical protein
MARKGCFANDDDDDDDQWSFFCFLFILYFAFIYIDSFRIWLLYINYIPIERPPLVGEVVPTFADRGRRVVSATDSHGR